MNREGDADRLAAASLAEGDATGWFDKLYAEAEQGVAQIPWDRPQATPLLTEWAEQTALTGGGAAALVVGCGLGRDAEFVAARGFATTAFDISPTAVKLARDRYPGSPVDYAVADLFDPPPAWRRGFALVIESNTVQALPRRLRREAAAAVAALVAPGGTLLVLAAATDEPAGDGPPWPLTEDEIALFATDGLAPASTDRLPAPHDHTGTRWRAVLHRP